MSQKHKSKLSEYKLEYLRDFEQRNKHLNLSNDKLFGAAEVPLSKLREPITKEEFLSYYDGSHWHLVDDTNLNQNSTVNKKADNEKTEQSQYFKKVKLFDILKNFIVLDEKEDADNIVRKIRACKLNPSEEEILISYDNKQFSTANDLIQSYISSYNKVAEWIDPECEILKNELRNLENELHEVQTEKYDLEKLISEFEHRYSLELGDLILNILKLKKKLVKDNPKEYEKANQEEEEFRQQIRKEKEKNIKELSKDEAAEIKKNFRKACLLCHPDKVDEGHKAEASDIFNNLKDAYDVNDLTKVNEILTKLKTEGFYKSKYNRVTEKEKLKSAIKNIQNDIASIKSEIDDIKNDEVYNTIEAISDWDEYFNNTKKSLITEEEKLMNSLT